MEELPCEGPAPSSASEAWIRYIQRPACQLGRRGSFAGVGELVTAIHAYIDAHNADPKPFIWTASVESILEKLNRCRAISRTDR